MSPLVLLYFLVTRDTAYYVVLFLETSRACAALADDESSISNQNAIDNVGSEFIRVGKAYRMQVIIENKGQ